MCMREGVDVCVVVVVAAIVLEAQPEITFAGVWRESHVSKRVLWTRRITSNAKAEAYAAFELDHSCCNRKAVTLRKVSPPVPM